MDQTIKNTSKIKLRNQLTIPIRS